MGCGASRLGPEGQAIPARFKPLLRGRLDNIRRRRNTCALNLDEDNCSKKELLLHGRYDEDHSQSLEQQSVAKSVASRDETSIDGNKKREAEEKSTKEETLKEVSKEGSPVPVILGENGEEKVVDDAEKREEVRQGHEEVEGEEEEDDDGYYSYDEGEQIGYGSPSFRVYFTDNLENEKNDDFPDAWKDESSNNMSQGGDNESHKECLTDGEKKRHKRRNFRKVIPRRGQMKKLWNVRSCTKPT